MHWITSYVLLRVLFRYRRDSELAKSNASTLCGHRSQDVISGASLCCGGLVNPSGYWAAGCLQGSAITFVSERRNRQFAPSMRLFSCPCGSSQDDVNAKVTAVGYYCGCRAFRCGAIANE